MYFDFKLMTAILAQKWKAQNDGPEGAGVPGDGADFLQGGVLQSQLWKAPSAPSWQEGRRATGGEQKILRNFLQTLQGDLVPRYDMNQLMKKL